MKIEDMQRNLKLFAVERDWEKYHTPKNLVMALTGEVGELAEIFQWLTAEEASAVMESEESAQRVRDELADVLSYVLRIADVLGVDIAQALTTKIAKNGEKYPVHLAKGNAKKYSELKKG